MYSHDDIGIGKQYEGLRRNVRVSGTHINILLRTKRNDTLRLMVPGHPGRVVHQG